MSPGAFLAYVPLRPDTRAVCEPIGGGLSLICFPAGRLHLAVFEPVVADGSEVEPKSVVGTESDGSVEMPFESADVDGCDGRPPSLLLPRPLFGRSILVRPVDGRLDNALIGRDFDAKPSFGAKMMFESNGNGAEG